MIDPGSMSSHISDRQPEGRKYVTHCQREILPWGFHILVFGSTNAVPKSACNTISAFQLSSTRRIHSRWKTSESKRIVGPDCGKDVGNVMLNRSTEPAYGPAAIRSERRGCPTRTHLDGRRTLHATAAGSLVMEADTYPSGSCLSLEETH